MVKETKDNPVSTNNYYKDLWSNPKTEAGQFFNKVDFNHKDYKDQEKVFRNFLKGLKRLMDSYVEQKPIETVLEVGAGTGRMTKIVLEELNPRQYVALDIKNRLVGCDYGVVSIEMDVNDIPGKLPFIQYDLIFCSEVFMHIKPEDIGSVLRRLTSLLTENGMIINIDWYHEKEPSEWCYIHDYEKMYRENGLYPVFEATINKQKLFCYGK